jgi:hypothetical protein
LETLVMRQEQPGASEPLRPLVFHKQIPFQPTMKSGFPHHRDSWISAAATSWVALALTYAAPVGAAPGRPAVSQQPPSVRTPQGERKIDFAQQIKG